MFKKIMKKKVKTNNIDNLKSEIQNNLLFQELSEIMTDQEEIKKKIVNKNNEFIELELTISESLTQTSYPIKFLLKISMKYPNEEPELFCITKFSYPHIFDGRNLIDEVLKSKWNNDTYNLDLIINRIPKFIIEFNSSLEDGYLLVVGKYTLNHLYLTERIRECPMFIKNVKEAQKLNNKLVKVNKILTISELSFCLYEKYSKIYSKLTFQNNLSNLVTMKRNTEHNTITFFWKNKDNDKDNIEVEIITEDTEEIKSILLEKMELFGKEYNVDQKIIQKRMGKLPCTDIEKVEKQIKVIEKEFEDKKNINMEMVHRLMSLYQKSVEYYSAINSPQFKIYTDKIKELMGTQKINELINKPEESNISTEDSSSAIPIPKKEKEEKIIIQGLNKIKNKLNSISGKKEKKETKETKDNKKINVPKVKVALSKEDEDGGTLDVGPDDEEEEEEEDDADDNNKENEKVDVINNESQKEEKKEEIKEEKDNNLNDKEITDKEKGNNLESKLEEQKTNDEN